MNLTRTGDKASLNVHGQSHDLQVIKGTAGPDVVDVSSGIESSPGVKDPWLMREFYAAATGQRAS